MAVYIDDMHRLSIGKLGRMKMSHLIADTREELLAMARKLRLRRAWLQRAETYGEHFDVCKSKRLDAVKAGAIPIAYRQFGMMCVRREVTGSLGEPHDALPWFTTYTACRRAGLTLGAGLTHPDASQAAVSTQEGRTQ